MGSDAAAIVYVVNCVNESSLEFEGFSMLRISPCVFVPPFGGVSEVANLTIGCWPSLLVRVPSATMLTIVVAPWVRIRAGMHLPRMCGGWQEVMLWFRMPRGRRVVALVEVPLC